MGNITLLNVDGNRRTRAARSAVLGRGSFRVAEASDGRTALDALREHADGPVLVLLRGELPDIETPELCRMLRDNASAPLFVARLRGPAGADTDAGADADACLRDHYR